MAETPDGKTEPLVSSDTMETLWLEADFLFHINGIPVLTTSTTVVKTTAGNCALIKKFIEKRTKPLAEGQQGEAGALREAFRAGFLAVHRAEGPYHMIRVWTFDGVAAADLEPEAWEAYKAQLAGLSRPEGTR